MSAFTAFRNVVSIGNATLSSEDIESNSEQLDVSYPLTNNIDLKIKGECVRLLAIGYYLKKWRGRTQCVWMTDAMRSLYVTAVVHDDSTKSTCSMCLEDSKVAERLRVLPCHHIKKKRTRRRR